MRGLCLVILACTLCLFSSFGLDKFPGAMGQPPSAPSLSAEEFPPYDMLAWNLARAAAAAQEADQLIAKSIVSPAAVQALARRGNWDEAFRILNKIIEDRPGDATAALDCIPDQLIRVRLGDRQKLDEIFRRAAADAKKRLPSLPEAEAAELAYRIAKYGSDPQNRAAGLKVFAEEYSGTDPAGYAEIDIITGDYRLPMPERIRRLDAFIAAHPGTRACARALYQKAWDLGRNMNVRGADPTEYFLQVFDIVAQLESGKYPDCEWTQKPLTLAPNASQAKYADENIARLLDACRAFATSHFQIDPQSPLGNGLGYMIKGLMGDLIKMQGGGAAEIEKELVDLEKKVPDAAGPRYLRALYSVDRIDPKTAPAEKEVLLSKAHALLADLQAAGSGLYQRKALATQASLYYSQKDYGKARELYRKYVEKFPQSSYAWVAALRIGRCEELQQDAKAAAESYRAAAIRYASIPVSPLLAHAYRARMLEALGRFDEARDAYSEALALWNLEEGTRCALDPSGGDLFAERRFPPGDSELARELLEDRRAQIARSLGAPGGEILERGRTLLDRGKRTEAVAALQQLRRQFPKSANAAAALVMIHKVGFNDALDLASDENPGADEAAAEKNLTDLASQPFDEAVCSAKIALAAMLWMRGKANQAEKILSEALAGWQEQQPKPQEPSGLAKEIAEMRGIVFKPFGDMLFNGFRSNGPRLPAVGSGLYLLVDPEISIKLADGVTRMTLIQNFPGLDKVLFADRERQLVLHDIMTKLGGTKRREPLSPMETPNQPRGNSMEILKLFNRFFPAFPGHWGGWEFLTYPRITRIHFLDKERTSARVSITIGYAGADVIMEKAGGKWQARGLTNQWIT